MPVDTWLSSPVPSLPGLLGSLGTVFCAHRVAQPGTASPESCTRGIPLPVSSHSSSSQERDTTGCQRLQEGPEIRAGCCLGNHVGSGNSGVPATSALHTCSPPRSSEPSRGTTRSPPPGAIMKGCARSCCAGASGLGAWCTLRTPGCVGATAGCAEGKPPGPRVP